MKLRQLKVNKDTNRGTNMRVSTPIRDFIDFNMSDLVDVVEVDKDGIEIRGENLDDIRGNFDEAELYDLIEESEGLDEAELHDLIEDFVEEGDLIEESSSEEEDLGSLVELDPSDLIEDMDLNDLIEGIEESDLQESIEDSDLNDLIEDVEDTDLNDLIEGVEESDLNDLIEDVGEDSLEGLVDFNIEDELESLIEDENLESLLDIDPESLIEIDTSSEGENPDLTYLRLDILIRFYRYIKNIVKGVGICYVCIILVIILTFGKGDSKQTKTVGSEKEWITSFTKGDFETCDNMAYKESDRLMGYDIELVGTYDKSVDMYKALLKRASDCVSRVLVLDDGSLRMDIRQVKSSEEVLVDEKALNNLIERYKESLLTKEDFEQGLVTLYYDAFEKTVTTEFTEDTKELEVNIKDVDNGHITNTNGFLRQLLNETGLQSNMKLFEDEVQSTFNYYVQNGE